MWALEQRGLVTCPGPHNRKVQRPILNVQCDPRAHNEVTAVSKATAGMSSVFKDHFFGVDSGRRGCPPLRVAGSVHLSH